MKASLRIGEWPFRGALSESVALKRLEALHVAGIEPECTAAWEAMADAIREAADEYGVLTASFYDKFNGVDHDQDAREKGYIADDGFHQSVGAGVTAQVEVLHALGYDPTIP